jgi:hypothetical protein
MAVTPGIGCSVKPGGYDPCASYPWLERVSG